MVRIFEQYLSDIGREGLLTPEDEASLARRARDGDLAARRRLVSANLRFVVSVARGYRGHGVPLADLVNEGNLGLCYAADRFDPSRGVRFISYAHFWVRRAMMQSISRHRGRSSSRELMPLPVSLDEPAAGSSHSMGELLEDVDSPAPEDGLARADLRRVLERTLSDLPSREREVVRLYFGLGARHAATLGEIADEIGVSRERARQLKEVGLARLRALAERHGLEGFASASETVLGRRAERPDRPSVAVLSGD